MKGSDKAIVLGIAMAVVLVGFYLKVLSPKREQASSLGKELTELQSQIDEQKQAAQFGEAARQDFPTYYGRLVVLGKAVPSQADTASLMVQLNSLANRTDVRFDGIELADAGSTAESSSSTSTSASTTSSTSASPTSASSSSSSSSSSGATPPAESTSAPATETSAANLPIGSAVGPAGLPIMPYNLTFTGSYFDVANFVKGVDDLVHMRGTGQVAADGRLMTIDGFSLAQPKGTGPSPELSVSLFVTSYVAPSSEGLTAGASPSGPATSLTQPDTQPTSQTVSP